MKALTEPKVSIVVPVYNGIKYIDVFLNCIKRQTYKNVEVIFVDDGSTDGTFEKCRSLEEDDCIKVFRKENGGPSSARNYGIEKATGDYICFFDIDDEFEENTLKDNVELAVKGNLDVVMWNFRMIILEDGREIVRPTGANFSGNSEEFFNKYLIPVLDNEMFNPPWNKMIRRQLIADNSIHFNASFSIYEDILFSYEIMQHAGKIAVNDKCYYKYIIKQAGSLLTKFHGECFEAIRAIYHAADKYCSMFSDNKIQTDRIKYQFIYLTKGHIKQICVDKTLSRKDKKQYLSKIRESSEYKELSREYDNSAKGIPAKLLMRAGWLGLLIFYYNILAGLTSRE